MHSPSRRKPFRDLHILCTQDSSLHTARLLVERIRHSKQLDQNQLEYLSERYGIPQSTANWLASLSPEERARLSIASNRTVDSMLTNGRNWIGYKEVTRAVTKTFIVLPAVFGTMPGDIELNHKWDTGESSVLRLDTAVFRGLHNAAIVFENYDVINVSSENATTKVTEYRPRGEIVLLENFPQQDGWYHNENDPELICPQGEKRYFRRFSPAAWFGPMVRSPFKVYGSSWTQNPRQEGKKRDKKTVYVGWDHFSSRFGSFVECLAPDQAKKQVQQMMLLPEQPAAQIQHGVVQLSAEKRAEIRRTVQALAMEFLHNPDAMSSSDYALVGDLAGIARKNPNLERELREDAALFSHWQLLQSRAAVTVEQWHNTFVRICTAFGVSKK